MIKDLEDIQNNKQKAFNDFLEKVVFLSQQCQINGLHNANILLPKLVEETFEREYINEIYKKLS